ncbi:hypothetical protein AKJ16_DCAP00891 [Drosera capensis]
MRSVEAVKGQVSDFKKDLFPCGGSFWAVGSMCTAGDSTGCPQQAIWLMFQLDVGNAFLHGDLCQEGYMRHHSGSAHPVIWFVAQGHHYMALHKHLRSDFLKLLGFRQCKNENSLFIKVDCLSITIIAVYVDDLLILLLYCTHPGNFMSNIRLGRKTDAEYVLIIERTTIYMASNLDGTRDDCQIRII